MKFYKVEIKEECPEWVMGPGTGDRDLCGKGLRFCVGPKSAKCPLEDWDMEAKGPYECQNHNCTYYHELGNSLTMGCNYDGIPPCLATQIIRLKEMLIEERTKRLEKEISHCTWEGPEMARDMAQIRKMAREQIEEELK